MERILDVAQFLFDEYLRVFEKQIDEMKLQKLLYFSQRESFAVSGQPLFRESMEGWKVGPVSVDVKTHFGKEGIKADTQEIGSDAQCLLKNVVLEYGSITSWRLSELIRQESSWRNSQKDFRTNKHRHYPLSLEDIRKDAEKVRPYDHVWDMYYDEFDDMPEPMVAG